MKRIIFFVIGMMLCCPSAFGGTINIAHLSSDSDVSLSYFNTLSSKIETVINGGIESVNITDATIAIADMASAASPAQREGDHFNAYTKSGMLPATDASDLTSDISAGTSYVKGDDGLLYRIVTAATAKTYTASKDTWVYIDKNGTFQYSEVTVGAAQPTTPADSLLLAQVTTDGDNITTVTDKRTLSISVGNNEDYIIKGFEINADNTSKCSADAGVVYHGTTRIEKPSFTNLTVATVGDWWDGVVDTGSAVFYYIGINSSGSIKFIGSTAPDKADTSGNTAGTKRYWYDGTNYWRVLGQIKVDASNVIQRHWWYGSGDYYRVKWNTPVSITTSVSSGTWSSATSCSAAIPAISKFGIFGMSSTNTAANAASIFIRPNGGTWATGNGNGVYLDTAGAGATSVGIGGQRLCATDGSQQIQYYNLLNSTAMTLDAEGYEGVR